jgi:NEDD8-activating enzyme E1
VKVTPYTKKIQTFDLSFYEGFHVIIAGLDNIEARRWLNGALHALVKFESEGVPDLTTVKVLFIKSFTNLQF